MINVRFWERTVWFWQLRAAISGSRSWDPPCAGRALAAARPVCLASSHADPVGGRPAVAVPAGAGAAGSRGQVGDHPSWPGQDRRRTDTSSGVAGIRLAWPGIGMLGAVGPGRRLWPFGGHGSVAGAAGAGLSRRLPGRPGHQAGAPIPVFGPDPGSSLRPGTGTVGRTSEARFSGPGRGTTPPRDGPETSGLHDMPDSGRFPNAFSCVNWHIRSKLHGSEDRLLDCVISLSRQAERLFVGLRSWVRMRCRAGIASSGRH